MRSDRGMEGSVKASGVDDGGGNGGEVGVGVLDDIVGNKNVGRGWGVVLNDIVGTRVAVEIALWVSASVVLTVGVDWPLSQEASMIAARNKMTRVFPKMFILPFPLMLKGNAQRFASVPGL
jgi:hypothetical protein